ncbi:MAG TPA: serine/threonine-protein kinase [Chthonomonadaceae bacterium]|nr:serine/threonine-protein kinase [Chthonomonadaceae bacterium]
MSAATLSNANTSIGPYRLVDFLGAGGMGEVYRAVDRSTGRTVAIKVLGRACAAPELRERFLNEARIQARLDHPHIARLYECILHAGRPCLVMEYVDGCTLSERIACSGPLPLSEALACLASIADAVHYMHRQGIVHRDIKAGNIRLCADGQAKLLDFGIARMESAPRLTRAGHIVGTIEYLSPEQLQGGEGDARSDIWALGILLYEMVTGRLPFEGDTFGDLHSKIRRAIYTPPSKRVRSGSAGVDAIVARCLKKDPGDRYASVADLGAAVRRLAARIASGAEEEASHSWLHSLWSAAACCRCSARRLAAVGYVGAASCSSNQSGGKPQHSKAGASSRTSKAGKAAAGAAFALVAAGALAFGRLTPQPQPAETGAVSAPTLQAPALSEPVALAAAPMKTVLVDVDEGQAEVFMNGRMLGWTPCALQEPLGQAIELDLRAAGYAPRHVAFTIGEDKREYTYSMEKQP